MRSLLGESQSMGQGDRWEVDGGVPGGRVRLTDRGEELACLFSQRWCHCLSCGGTTLSLLKILASYRKRTDEGLNIATVGGRRGDRGTGMWWNWLCQKRSGNPMGPGEDSSPQG